MEAYLDNGATTMADSEVVKAMGFYHLNAYGNASSIHLKGEEAKNALANARHTIASSIGAKDHEIIFTSGGTESNNLAIKGIAFRNPGKHIITTKVEHDSVLNACRWLEKRGYKVTYLNVDSEGFLSPERLEKAITKDTILVSVIHGNNEIGTIQGLKALYEVCKKHKVLLHTDACQSYTKSPLSAEDADLISLNAHKLHGPKGVGALYVRRGIKLDPIAHGGNQELKLRSGTENIPGIVGFAKAVELAMNKKYTEKITVLRDYIIKEALKIPDTTLNGPTGEKRLCNNISLSFRFIEGESLVAMLSAKGICASTGSACSSHSLEPSHVIMAISNDVERAHGSLRLTLSRFTTKEEADYALKELKQAVETLRKMSPLR